MVEAPTTGSLSDNSWVGRLREGLARTRSRLTGLIGRGEIDGALFEDLEAALLASDAGMDATRLVLERLRLHTRAASGESLKTALAAILVELLAPLEQPLAIPDAKPWVVMLAGVNGVGKTTSIGKLARYFQSKGQSVLLAGGDTFRAAAREQLAAWGERNGVAVVAQTGGDPAAVAFDAVSAARARKIDLVIADTAGRLPTQQHLMDELRKIKGVIAKAQPGAPHEIWCVLDANSGQNALRQVEAFDNTLGLTGLILTKLDGTAKGGVVCAIALARAAAGKPVIPLRFIGVGEGIGDLRPFAATEFARALLD
jgi:fused signal recognition particle receptor